MRSLAFFALLVAFADCCETSLADDVLSISGVVVDADGKPINEATVSAMWRANGSGRKPDGTMLDLSDEKQRAEFWGNLGNMQPISEPKGRAVTRSDGSFSVQVHPRFRVLFAMDSTRKLGAISAIPVPSSGQTVTIQLAPLVTVYGRLQSVVDSKTAHWSHVYVEIPEDAKQPISLNRIVSCGSFDGRFRFQLPPGTYSLDAYAISKPGSDDFDLAVQPTPTFTVDGSQSELDLGALELKLAPPDRSDLESLAKTEGRWKDFTKHYGETAPNWNAVDARGIHKGATIESFRGKWLLINFWGLECAPCLSTGIPKLMDFYEEHSDQREHFEIVGICVDYSGRLKSMRDVDEAMVPLVAHLWKGRKISFPIVLDNTFTTWERYGIPGLGTVVLVGPDGKLMDGDETTLATLLQRRAEHADEPDQD